MKGSMKRYLAFGYCTYEPGSGGWEDFQGDFDLLSDAAVAAAWWSGWHVVDVQTREIILSHVMVAAEEWQARMAIENRRTRRERISTDIGGRREQRRP